MLTESHLPLAGVSETLPGFVVPESDNTIVGTAALEVCCENALLRSVAVIAGRAKETCPVFPGQPAFAHWGMDDPSDVIGSDDARRRAFRDVVNHLARRIDLLLALPVERLERAALERRAQAIADEVPGRRATTLELS